MSAWLVVAVACLLTAVACRRTMRHARRQVAMEINDDIVQGLTRVKWALEGQRPGEALTAADETLAAAQRKVTRLLSPSRSARARPTE